MCLLCSATLMAVGMQQCYTVKGGRLESELPCAFQAVSNILLQTVMASLAKARPPSTKLTAKGTDSTWTRSCPVITRVMMSLRCYLWLAVSHLDGHFLKWQSQEKTPHKRSGPGPSPLSLLRLVPPSPPGSMSPGQPLPPDSCCSMSP